MGEKIEDKKETKYCEEKNKTKKRKMVVRLYAKGSKSDKSHAIIIIIATQGQIVQND